MRSLISNHRHSIARCITTFKRPYALLSDSVGHIEDYSLVSHMRMDHEITNIFFQESCPDESLLTILESVNIFISDLATWYGAGRTPYLLDPFDLQKHSCLLMYRLFDWYQLGEDSEIAGGKGREPIDQAICLAHLICLVIATEPYGQSFGSRLSNIVVKLRQALQRIPVSHWATASNVLLWVVTMGAIGAKGLPRFQQHSISEFDFFSQYSQHLFAPTQTGGFITAHSLLERLHGSPWISIVFDARAKRLWALMGFCMPDIADMYESSSEEEGIPIDDEHALGQSTTARFFPAAKPVSRRLSAR